MHYPEESVALDLALFRKAIRMAPGSLRCIFEHKDFLYSIDAQQFLDEGTRFDYGQSKQIRLAISRMSRRPKADNQQLILLQVTSAGAEA